LQQLRKGLSEVSVIKMENNDCIAIIKQAEIEAPHSNQITRLLQQSDNQTEEGTKETSEPYILAILESKLSLSVIEEWFVSWRGWVKCHWNYH